MFIRCMCTCVHVYMCTCVHVYSIGSTLGEPNVLSDLALDVVESLPSRVSV
jgi:hypothetical protein